MAGDRARRAYGMLRLEILQGVFPVGAKLPSHTELAERLNVSPVTMRRVLADLGRDGLLSLEQGRGTFVRSNSLPGVLIVDDDPGSRALLVEYVSQADYRCVEASNPD